MTVRELGAQIRARKISCVELVQKTLKDILERDKFNSLITVTAEQALATARERDEELAAGKDRGPFHGIPIALKDLFYTKGVKTTAGSLVYKDFVPEYDAEVVKRLREAGAISIGKTNLHEIAFGITSKNPHLWVCAESAGSESIGGWIEWWIGGVGGRWSSCRWRWGRIRADRFVCRRRFAELRDLKPTYGLVSRHGVLPLAFSLDHVGPLGRTVEDCALALNAMVGGEDYNVPTPADLKGLRVGVITDDCDVMALGGRRG